MYPYWQEPFDLEQPILNNKDNQPLAFLVIFLKGMAMGAADVVPGVSGGTIAFISGIYDRLLAAISACTPAKLIWLLKGRFRETWQAIDGAFLFTLLAGILTSIASLARLISYLLDNHPELIWSFFFGLILVSVVLICKQIKRWNIWTVGVLVLGAVFAYLITVAAPLQWPATPLMIFIAGSIAICAMILPGISGSFILLLLGLYAVVLGAVKDFNLSLISVFALGCIAGLLSFSRLLSWLLEQARNMTLAFLTGLLVGSLNKVWPWKEVISWRVDSQGERVPLLESNLWPQHYQAVTGEPAYWQWGLVLMIAAVVLVLLLEWLGKRVSN
ncbi:MAG: putative membrane protein [Halopseudomonas sp.]